MISPIDYKAVLEDLESRKGDLEAAIRSIRKILGEEPAAAVPGHQAPRPQKEQADSDMSMAEKLLRFLNGHPGQAFTIQGVVSGIGHSGSTKPIRRTLWRLADTEKIKRVSRGKYKSLAQKVVGASVFDSWEVKEEVK